MHIMVNSRSTSVVNNAVQYFPNHNNSYIKTFPKIICLKYISYKVEYLGKQMECFFWLF